MKHLLLLLLIVLTYSSSHAQNDSIKNIGFKLHFPADSLNMTGVDFTKEKPECEFELKGKIPLKYSFRLQNDSIASLYQFKNNEFQFQENMDYQPFLWHLDDDILFSNFKIIDFDNDGDEDVLCWVFSNVNGNQWTIIFINDQTQQKLVRLYNSADDTDIWSRPEFDKETNTINTELYGSVYGVSEEGSYHLKPDLTITPIKKHFQDRTGKRMYDYEYEGKNGKWKLKSKTKVKN